jgi:hypothetical protein
MSQIAIVRVANSGKETHIEVLHRQLTGERVPRTHQTSREILKASV